MMRGVYRRWVWLRRRGLRWVGLIVTLGPDLALFFSVGIIHIFFRCFKSILVDYTIVAFFRHYALSLSLFHLPSFLSMLHRFPANNTFFSAALTSLSGFFSTGHSAETASIYHLIHDFVSIMYIAN